MGLREIEWGGLGWTDLVQDRNMVMNSGFHKMLGSSRVVAQLAASQEGLSSMKLVSCISLQ
jgi:hypothetical protein